MSRRLEPGDHIYCKRKGGLYDHHGIYVGDGMVIHVRGKGKKVRPLRPCQKCGNKRVINGEIAKVCLDCFCKGKRIEVYDYGVPSSEFTIRRSGTCSRHHSKPPDEVIRTATAFLDHTTSSGYSYNIFSNNCEGFAVLCKTSSSHSSAQVAGFAVAGAICLGAIVIFPPVGLALAGTYMAFKFIRR